jgi:hypothetical protein
VRAAISGTLAALALAGCVVVDDQTVLRPEHVAIANPEPAPRDFRQVNARHRVVLAIFDTGVDYNHPELLPNMRFELDGQGKPVSMGIDFLGLDKWSSYRVVATRMYPYADRSEEIRNTIRKSYASIELHDRKMRDLYGEQQCAAAEMLRLEPALGKYVQPYRDTKAESVQLLHGTHVAGLMTYDRPDFGLIAYRFLPYHTTWTDKEEEARGQASAATSRKPARTPSARARAW